MCVSFTLLPPLPSCSNAVETLVSEWTSSTVYWSCISGLEVFIVSSGVDVALVAEKLNSSSGEDAIHKQMSYTHTHTMCGQSNEVLPRPFTRMCIGHFISESCGHELHSFHKQCTSFEGA